MTQAAISIMQTKSFVYSNRNRVPWPRVAPPCFSGRSYPAYTEILASPPNTSPVVFGMRIWPNGCYADLFRKAANIRIVCNAHTLLSLSVELIQWAERTIFGLQIRGTNHFIRRTSKDQGNELFPNYNLGHPLQHCMTRSQCTGLYTDAEIRYPTRWLKYSKFMHHLFLICSLD
jgi:hypothetical protein